jgi:hypothetical protein
MLTKVKARVVGWAALQVALLKCLVMGSGWAWEMGWG